MDRVDPVQTVYPSSIVQPVRGNAYDHGVRKSNETFNEPSFRSARKESLQMPSGGKLVPSDERLSTLQDVFDDKTLKQLGIVECMTCASRTYQDKSDDSSVSFQSPTRLSPEQAASAVITHEMEHVSNEKIDAKNNNKEVIAQSVQIFHSICPECGISYVSGGLTQTTTASSGNPYKDALTNKAAGNLVDMML